MAGLKMNRLLVERALPQDGEARRGSGAASGRQAQRARSVTVNLAESLLGWLRARGHVDARQFEAGERLRCDWERASCRPR